MRMRSSRAAGALAVMLGAVPPAIAQQAPRGDTCVDVRIGDARAYDCLNRQLERAVPRRRFSAATDAPSVAAPATAVGTFSEAATRERLGTAFGHSVQPQRPPPVVWSAPLAQH